MKNTAYIAIIQALLAAVLFGISAPLSKVLLGDIEPLLLAALLYIGSGIGSGLLLLIQNVSRRGRKIEAQLTKNDLPWLFGAILAGGVAAPILLLVGLQLTPASTASLLLNFEGVATTLLAVFIFRESVGKHIYLAVSLITFASILLTWNGGAWGFSLAALAILGACLLWGLDNNLTRNISAKNPLIIVAIKGLGAGGFSLLLALILGKPLPGWGMIGLALLLGAVSYGLSIQLFILALRNLGAARTGALFGIAPFVGSAFSLLVLRESPQPLFFAAIPFMLIGAWLMLSEKHQHGHVHEPLEHTHSHTHTDGHHNHLHAGISDNGDARHAHNHTHEGITHSHPHAPDLHHRHVHQKTEQ